MKFNALTRLIRIASSETTRIEYIENCTNARNPTRRQKIDWSVKGPQNLALVVYAAVIISCIPTTLALPRNERESGFPDNREEFGTEPANDDLSDGSEFLKRFGYIQDIPGAYRSKDEVRDALVRLQAMAQIPQTGRVDAATREVMTSPRCGVPDGPTGDPNNPNNPLQYELGPTKWEKNVLTYKVSPYKLTRDLPERVIREDLKGAMALWERVTPLRFVDADTSQGAQYVRKEGMVDIEVTFDRLEHGDGSPFDGPGRVLAHAFSPGKGRGGDVHFDDDETWSSQSTKGVNFLIVAAHELGHSLGLDHSKEKGSLMYPWYAGYVPNYQLPSDDVAGIQHLYGNGVSQWTTPATRMATMRAAATMSPTASSGSSGGSYPGRMDTCGRIDAVSLIRGEIFVFYSKWFWRITREAVSDPIELHRFWNGLPRSVQTIDAAFERPENGIIVLFHRDRYYEFDANDIRREVPYGTPISDLGLPSDVTHIDAALDYNRRVYLFSGRRYWRLAIGDKAGRMKVENFHPYNVAQVGRGVQFPIDGAFTDSEHRTYFIQGTQFWLYDEAEYRNYPQPIHHLWRHCEPSGIGSAASSPRHTAMTSCFLALAQLIFGLIILCKVHLVRL